MKKHLLTIAVSFITTTCLWGQADCVIIFRYKGIIDSDSIKFQQIGLPTTPFIVGYKKKSDQRAFSVYNITDTVFNIKMASHLSSDFCRSQEDIVAFVFKRLKEYPILLFDTQTKSNSKAIPIEITIPTDLIKFYYETVDNRKEIIIDLGNIKSRTNAQQ